MINIPRPRIARKSTDRQMRRKSIPRIPPHIVRQSSRKPTLNLQERRLRIRFTTDQPRPPTRRKRPQPPRSQLKTRKTGNRSGHRLLNLLQFIHRRRPNELKREVDLFKWRRSVICRLEFPKRSQHRSYRPFRRINRNKQPQLFGRMRHAQKSLYRSRADQTPRPRQEKSTQASSRRRVLASAPESPHAHDQAPHPASSPRSS